MEESSAALAGSCSQNTLKNKRLEHQSYRQERDFIGRAWLSRETHSGDWKPVSPQVLERGDMISALN
jgi:hypothetical protein